MTIGLLSGENYSSSREINDERGTLTAYEAPSTAHYWQLEDESTDRRPSAEAIYGTS
jgi:hypothetical protein